VTCLIGNGVVVNPAILIKEMEALAEKGVDVTPAHLKLSRQAHVITPVHIALDRAHEARRGKGAIGTTLRGIGPAYRDKSARSGLRAQLFADPGALAGAIHEHVTENNKLLGLYGEPLLDPEAIAAEFAACARRLAPHLVESTPYLNEALEAGRTILAEGAQGTLLDLDHGTYPYVTSSHPTAGGALVGLGVGPKAVRRVIGVAKAFTTRVGGGPFPCELDGELAGRLRGTGEQPWDEFGTTTGRPRRVGWLDLNILRHARRVNGLTEMALTKLDILSGLSELAVCVGYELDGQQIDYFPGDVAALSRVQPLYEWLPGWQEDVTGARRPSDLPENACRYVEFVAVGLDLPITLVSVGPARDQIVQGW
jgi:adenylosuccinate synthase